MSGAAEVQRWGYDYRHDEIKHDSGKWVKYADHARAIERREARVDELYDRVEGLTTLVRNEQARKDRIWALIEKYDSEDGEVKHRHVVRELWAVLTEPANKPEAADAAPKPEVFRHWKPAPVPVIPVGEGEGRECPKCGSDDPGRTRPAPGFKWDYPCPDPFHAFAHSGEAALSGGEVGDREGGEPTRWELDGEFYVKDGEPTFRAIQPGDVGLLPNGNPWQWKTAWGKSDSAVIQFLRPARTFTCPDGTDRMETGEVLDAVPQGKWFLLDDKPRKALTRIDISGPHPILAPVPPPENGQTSGGEQ